MKEKACPVIIRHRDGVRQILSFTHPVAGNQLVKGTIEPGEEREHAARRELAEESGLMNAPPGRLLGDWVNSQRAQHWFFFQFEMPDELPDEWEFFTSDGGGMLFKFFWFDLEQTVDTRWHPTFVEAISQIRSFLA